MLLRCFLRREESPKRLIEPPQDLLLGGVGVEREPFVGGTDGFEFVRLIEIAQAQTTAAVGFDALLEPRVVQSQKAPSIPVRASACARFG